MSHTLKQFNIYHLSIENQLTLLLNNYFLQSTGDLSTLLFQHALNNQIDNTAIQQSIHKNKIVPNFNQHYRTKEGWKPLKHVVIHLLEMLHYVIIGHSVDGYLKNLLSSSLTES